jgi:hypothetical protein
MCSLALIAAFHAAHARGAASLTYRADQAVALPALEMALGNPVSGIRRVPLTDIVVRLQAWAGEPLERVLAEPSTGQPAAAAPRARFAADLIVAAGGRIHIAERAACGAWTGDLAICRTECDGGAFVLRRVRRAGGRPAFAFLVGRVEAVREAGFGDSIRLGACSDSAPEASLVLRGPAASVEISLVRD